MPHNLDALLKRPENMEYETPDFLFEILNREFHFTRDVCASDDNHKLEPYWTTQFDALMQDWDGVNWMNPPYGEWLPLFMYKAFMEAQKGHATTVCLVPARTDTYWWAECVAQPGVEVRFINGRLTFGGAVSTAPFPSAIVIMHKKGRGRRRSPLQMLVLPGRKFGRRCKDAFNKYFQEHWL